MNRAPLEYLERKIEEPNGNENHPDILQVSCLLSWLATEEFLSCIIERHHGEGKGGRMMNWLLIMLQGPDPLKGFAEHLQISLTSAQHGTGSGCVYVWAILPCVMLHELCFVEAASLCTYEPCHPPRMS